MEDLQDLSREDLLKLLVVQAKNWLAHDGCWFLAAEGEYGMDTAIALDTRSWELFSPAEARRIMKAFQIPQGGGLEALEKALGYRLYATINRHAVERPDKDRLIYKMIDCQVQTARRRKGLADFPANRSAWSSTPSSPRPSTRASKPAASNVPRTAPKARAASAPGSSGYEHGPAGGARQSAERPGHGETRPVCG